MPRTSRFSVRFPMPHPTSGKPSSQPDWTVTFIHRHNEVDGINYMDAITGNKSVNVKHVTEARLSSVNNPSTFVKGVALTSHKDQYDWRQGIKRAFQRALAKAGFCEEVRTRSACSGLCSKDGVCAPGIDHEWNGLTKHYRYQDFIPLKEEYGQAMESFYMELQHKDYPPHNVAPVNPDVPAETKNGTFHLGAD